VGTLRLFYLIFIVGRMSSTASDSKMEAAAAEEAPVKAPPSKEEEEEEDEEDLEKLQAEIARMEEEAARIAKETEELRAKSKSAQGGSAASASASSSTGTSAATSSSDKAADGVKRDGLSVYVGQVDYTSTPEELLAHFEACGTVERVTIVCDKFSGRPKGTIQIDSS
jgi:polyadenylate-binding protein 2